MGEKPRRHPLDKPAGIRECEDDSLKRWILDNYSVPPEVLHSRRAAENERLMEFPTAYTESGVTSSELKHHPRGSELVRVSLLGDAFQVGIFSWFLAHLAVELGYLQMLPDLDQFCTGLSRAQQIC